MKDHVKVKKNNIYNKKTHFTDKKIREKTYKKLISFAEQGTYEIKEKIKCILPSLNNLWFY